MIERLGQLLTPFVVVLVGATAAGFGARLWWAFELFSHFRVQLLLGALLVSCGLLAASRRGWAVTAGVVALVNLAVIVPLYLPPAPPSGPVDLDRPVRLLLANVERRNRSFDAVGELIDAEAPDVVGLVEPDSTWLDALESSLTPYPHRLVEPRVDNFGMALYSRHPFVDSRVETFDGRGPSLVATLDVDGRPLTVYLTHPFPPVGGADAASRNAQLAALTRAVADEPDDVPVVLMGDLNATSWSPYFQDLLEGSSLRDSRQGRGTHPTWGPFWARLPIDHVLHSAHMLTVDRHVGPDIGSDHRPVIVDLAW